MANVLADGTTVGRTETYVEEEGCYYSWVEDYIERLVGKDEYRKFQEFQEHHDNAHDYYVLMASLLA